MACKHVPSNQKSTVNVASSFCKIIFRSEPDTVEGSTRPDVRASLTYVSAAWSFTQSHIIADISLFAHFLSTRFDAIEARGSSSWKIFWPKCKYLIGRGSAWNIPEMYTSHPEVCEIKLSHKTCTIKRFSSVFLSVDSRKKERMLSVWVKLVTSRFADRRNYKYCRQSECDFSSFLDITRLYRDGGIFFVALRARKSEKNWRQQELILAFLIYLPFLFSK